VLLGGCLTEDASETQEPEATEIQISGSVGDGPIVGAALTITSNTGELLDTSQSDGLAGYESTLKVRGNQYPLLVESTGGTDLVTGLAPDMRLEGAVISPGQRAIANINPFTTVAIALARELPGGVTRGNVDAAHDTVTLALGSGLDSLAGDAVLTTPINDGNVVEIVLASETLAEMLRRTSTALSAAGYAATTDDVLGAIGADLTDGVVDGRGSIAADARTAAVVTLVYGQVLLETMAGELHVNGIDATAAMDAAIAQVSMNTPTESVSERQIADQMIERARVGVAAAVLLDDTDAVARLHGAVSGLQAGMDPTTARAVLPNNYRSRLQFALDAVASADLDTLEAINALARSSGDLPAMNGAPTISGTPLASVEVGESYRFVPDATDPDGDPLQFTVSGLPAWASFDPATGELSGTPAAGDVGTYPDIVITVSDGMHSVSLDTFAVNVTQGNLPPTISGTPPASAQAGDAYSFVPTASDPDGDSLTFSIANRPGWATFNSATGELSGTPVDADAGNYPNIRISVTDGLFTTSLPAFAISVLAGNRPPGISGNPPQSVNVGATYRFTPAASDPDGDALSFTVTNLPRWASFDSQTGELSGTPQDGDEGTYSGIRITVSDGTSSAALQFDIDVSASPLGSVTLSWTAPTENEDGSALTNLAGYRIYRGTTPGNYDETITIDNPSVTTYVVENLAPGTYEFVATAFNVDGRESSFSGSLLVTIP